MINTVMFDMGGTIEDLYHGERTYRRTAAALLELLEKHGIHAGMDADALWSCVYPGFLAYREWGEAHCYELKPAKIWTEFALKNSDIDPGLIIPIAEEIAHMWELTYFERGLRKGVPEMLAGLKSLGLRLSVISNTACEFQVFDTLEEYGIRQYFGDVTLSSVVGYRKPDPRIFQIALRQMRAKAENSVYVGDTLSRDIIGSKKAGFAVAIQINSFLTQSRDANVPDSVKPDYRVDNIYDVFPLMEEYMKTH